jgi:hypothetical protein
MKKQSGPSVSYTLSQVRDEELRSRLEHRFIEFEALKAGNVTAQRTALRAQSNAIRSAAEVQISQLDFLMEAGEAFDLIATEPLWMVRRRGDGEVVLECLLTEKDMHNMARAQSKQMKDQIAEITGPEHTEEDEDTDNQMFQ